MAQRAGDDFWSSLSPDEQDQVISMFSGITGPTMADYGFEDDLGAMDPTMGGGFDFGLSGMGSPMQPNVGGYATKGKIDFGDRTQEAGRVNLLQDYGSLSVDNILSGYGGGGSYDIDAFTPTYEFGEPLNLKGKRRAETLAGSGGYQGFLADLILNEGLTDAEAEAKLYEVVNAPDEGLSRQDAAKRQALIDTLPPSMRDDGLDLPSSRSGGGAKARAGREQWDTDIIHENAASIWNGLMDDPEFAHEENGQYYSKTPEEAMVKTPQMLAYDKFGIPYPTATYDDPKYMKEFTEEIGGRPIEEIPGLTEDYQAEQRELARRRNAEFGESRRSADSLSDLEKVWGQYEADPQGFARPSGPRENPYNLPKMSMDAARAAADINYDAREDNPQFKAMLAAAMGKAREPAGPSRVIGKGGPSVIGQVEPPSNVIDKARGQAATAAAEAQFQDAMMQEAMLRGAGSQGINTPGQAPFVRERANGDVTPFTFGAEPAGIRDFGASLFGGDKTRNPRRLNEGDINKQKTRTDAQRKQAYKAYAAEKAAQWTDPRLAQVAAMGRAYALAQAGQTPFRDAMASRNANARRMLGGG